jgi:hypothetical protein
MVLDASVVTWCFDLRASHVLCLVLVNWFIMFIICSGINKMLGIMNDIVDYKILPANFK